MKLNLNFLKKAFILPILVVALTSCSSSTQSIIQYDEVVNISFSWWGNDDRNEYTLDAIKDFEKLHKNISVTCNYSEWSGYQTKMDIQMASHTQSDVMQINFAWINQYSQNEDVYYNIYQLADVVDLTNFTQQELDFGIKDGRLCAIPIALNSQILYYNKDIYDSYGLDIPTTWDDLFKCAEVMSKDGIYPLAVSASKPFLFLAISYTEQVTNHTFMTEDNTIGFDENDVAIMLEFTKRLLDEKVSPPLNDFTKANISSGNYAGTVAWITDATNYCPEGMNFVTGDFLTTDTATTLGWYSKPSTMYAINSYTEHPTEAGILLDFLLNSTEMADAQKLEKGIPLSSSAQSYLEVEDLLQGIQFEAFKTFEERSLDMDTMNPYVENQTLIDAFQDAVDVVYYKDSSVDSQARTLLKKFNEILSGLLEE